MALRKSIAFLGLSIAIVATPLQAKPHKHHAPKAHWVTLKHVQAFSQLKVSGVAHVVVKPSHTKQPIIKLRESSLLKVSADHGRLEIYKKGYTSNSKDVDVRVFVPNLNNLETQDAAIVTVGKVKTQGGLDIVYNSIAPLTLDGHYQVKRIAHQSNGLLKLHWVDSDQLSLESHGGHMELAGRAHHLAVRAYGDAQVNAQDVRSEDVWVAAADRAHVEVRALDDLHVYGSDHSLVNYHARKRFQKHYLKTEDYARAVFVK